MTDATTTSWTYIFREGPLRMVLTIGPQASFQDATGQLHVGYPITGGTLNSASYFQKGLSILPQTTAPYNVLWAAPAGPGRKGNWCGIDTHGLAFADNGMLSWSGTGNIFHRHIGLLQPRVTLARTEPPWPPSS